MKRRIYSGRASTFPGTRSLTIGDYRFNFAFGSSPLVSKSAKVHCSAGHFGEQGLENFSFSLSTCEREFPVEMTGGCTLDCNKQSCNQF